MWTFHDQHTTSVFLLHLFLHHTNDCSQMDHMGCLNYTVRCPVGVGMCLSIHTILLFSLVHHSLLYGLSVLNFSVYSWSHKPMEPAVVPPDLEDRPGSCCRQYCGGETQWNDLRHCLDDVSAIGGSWWGICVFIYVRFEKEVVHPKMKIC